MKTKIIPFDVELAKKIQAGEIEGKIVRNGYEVIILDYNSKKNSIHPNYPIRIVYLDRDEVDYVTHEGLYIKVPDNEPQFKPFDKVLVRDCDENEWHISFFSHMKDDWFITNNGHMYKYCIPYEGNQHLVGTTDKPKED